MPPAPAPPFTVVATVAVPLSEEDLDRMEALGYPDLSLLLRAGLGELETRVVEQAALDGLAMKENPA